MLNTKKEIEKYYKKFFDDPITHPNELFEEWWDENLLHARGMKYMARKCFIMGFLKCAESSNCMLNKQKKTKTKTRRKILLS